MRSILEIKNEELKMKNISLISSIATAGMMFIALLAICITGYHLVRDDSDTITQLNTKSAKNLVTEIKDNKVLSFQLFELPKNKEIAITNEEVLIYPDLMIGQVGISPSSKLVDDLVLTIYTENVIKLNRIITANGTKELDKNQEYKSLQLQTRQLAYWLCGYRLDLTLENIQEYGKNSILVHGEKQKIE